MCRGGGVKVSGEEKTEVTEFCFYDESLFCFAVCRNNKISFTYTLFYILRSYVDYLHWNDGSRICRVCRLTFLAASISAHLLDNQISAKQWFSNFAVGQGASVRKILPPPSGGGGIRQRERQVASGLT